jgi:hypothetical protein
MSQTITPEISTAVSATPPDARDAARMQGVHTLLAMPQWYVNLGLDNLLQYGRTTTGGSLKDVALRMAKGGDPWLSGTVSTIAAAVYVADNPGQVKFLVTFGSGTMQYDSGKSSCDVSGLLLAVRVDLSKAQADGLKPGGFTIERLFMDLQAASAASYDASTSFPASMPEAAKQQFPDLVKQYLLEAAAASGTLLGYAVEVPAASDPAATYPPTGLRLVTNQFQGSSQGVPARDPDVDTVTYLAMTGGQQFPQNLTAWWGNFVLPSDGKDPEVPWYGTIAVARDLLLDFLLPAVSPQACAYWKLNDASGTLDIQHDAAAGVLQKTADGGTWQSGDLHSRSRRGNAGSTDDAEFWFNWKVDLVAAPGTNAITITRNATFKVKATHWYGVPDFWLTATSECELDYYVPVTITITVLGVMDGKLQVKVTSSTKQPDSGHVYAEPYGWDITGHSGNLPPWSDVASTMENAMNNGINASVPEIIAGGIETRIADILNNTPFVLPGGSQLNMINPCFNDERDLLLGVSYKA